MDKLIRFALLPAWQAHRVGLRLGRATSSALQPVLTGSNGPTHRNAVRGRPRRHLYIARSHPPGPSAPAPWPKRSRKFWRSSVSRTNLSALTSSKCPSSRVREGGNDVGRWSTGLPRGPSHQDDRRDLVLAHAASMVDTAYEELYSFLRPEYGERVRRSGEQNAVRLGFRTRRRRQRHFR